MKKIFTLIIAVAALTVTGCCGGKADKKAADDTTKAGVECCEKDCCKGEEGCCAEKKEGCCCEGDSCCEGEAKSCCEKAE